MAAMSVALILSACGSTVQASYRGPASDSGRELGGNEFALGRDQSNENDAVGGDSRSEASGRRRSVQRGDVESSNVGHPSVDGARSTGPERSGTEPSSGPGFTKKEIFIGFANTRPDGFTAAAGVESSFGNAEDYAKTVIKDINARGGIAGRKVVPVFVEVPFEQFVNDPNGSTQPVCEKWTNDRRVFAATGFVDSPALAKCLARRHVIWAPIWTSLSRPSRILDGAAPYVYTPPQLSMERLAHAMVMRSRALGYFAGWDYDSGSPGRLPARIGVITVRIAYGSDFERVIKAELSRHGLAVKAVGELYGSADNQVKQYEEMALRFRRLGVSHVITQHNLVAPAIVFGNQTRYYPRYMLTTHVEPRFAQDQGGAIKESLTGAVGIGYRPTVDVDGKRDPGPIGHVETRCVKTMRNGGHDTSSRDALHLMFAVCDTFKFFSLAIERGALTPDGFQRGTVSMGPMAAAGTFRMKFQGGRLDGVDAVRDLGFREDCGCFKYLSSNRGV